VKTVFAIAWLLVLGLVAGGTVTVVLLNIAGLPGALLAGRPGKRSLARFYVGTTVCALGQSYIYLAYAAFIVDWTMLAARRPNTIGFVLWPLAFLVVFAPICVQLIRARAKASKLPHANPQIEALHVTALVALVGFFIFAFTPTAMRIAWSWVPHIWSCEVKY